MIAATHTHAWSCMACSQMLTGRGATVLQLQGSHLGACCCHRRHIFLDIETLQGPDKTQDLGKDVGACWQDCGLP